MLHHSSTHRDIIFLYQLAQARPHNVLHFLVVIVNESMVVLCRNRLLVFQSQNCVQRLYCRTLVKDGAHICHIDISSICAFTVCMSSAVERYGTLNMVCNQINVQFLPTYVAVPGRNRTMRIYRIQSTVVQNFH